MVARQPAQCPTTTVIPPNRESGGGVWRKKKNEEEKRKEADLENGKWGRETACHSLLYPRGPSQTELAGLSPRVLTPDFTSNRF